MEKKISLVWVLSIVAMLAVMMMGLRPVMAANLVGVDDDVRAALSKLYDHTPAAKALGEKAKAILVFPTVVKAGFLFGGQYGHGELLKGGKMDGYYNIAAASYGLQAGIQSFAYVMFLMTDSAVTYLENTEGFEIGVGPSVVIVDEGMAKTLTTSTAQESIYGFIFGQKGLMAGVGLQGSKISRIR